MGLVQDPSLFWASASSPSTTGFLTLSIHDCKAAAACSSGHHGQVQRQGVSVGVENSKSKLSSCTGCFPQKAESFPEAIWRLLLTPQWLEQLEANPGHRGSGKWRQSKWHILCDSSLGLWMCYLPEQNWCSVNKRKGKMVAFHLPNRCPFSLEGKLFCFTR